MNSSKASTTEPKVRRHGNWKSGKTAQQFMEHLWNRGLRKKASYDTLKYEFIHARGMVILKVT